MMENAEEILHCLDEYTKGKPKDIPRELEDYLCFVARTGDPVYQWSLIKTLFREKLLNVITDFYETCPTVEIPPCPNVETFNYDVMKTFILEKLESFAAAPFTVQRICELLTTPRKEYNRIDKYMRALEKNILVVSTREPGPQNRRSTENGDDSSMLNGLENDSIAPNVLSNDGHVEVDMEEAPIWSPKSIITEPITIEPAAEEKDTKEDVKPPDVVAEEETTVTEETEKPDETMSTETEPTEPVKDAQLEDTPVIESMEASSSTDETENPSISAEPVMEISSNCDSPTVESTTSDIFIEQAKLENEDEAAGQELYFSIIADDANQRIKVILPITPETDKKVDDDTEKVVEKEMVVDKISEEVKEETQVEQTIEVPSEVKEEEVSDFVETPVEEAPVSEQSEITESVVTEEIIEKDEKESMEIQTVEEESVPEVTEELETKVENVEIIAPEVVVEETVETIEKDPEMEQDAITPEMEDVTTSELPKTEIEPEISKKVIEEIQPVVEEVVESTTKEEIIEEKVEEEVELPKSEIVEETPVVENVIVPEDSPKEEKSSTEKEEETSTNIPPEEDESSQ